MIITRSLRLFKVAGLIAALTIGLGACSSSDEQQEQGDDLESNQQEDAQNANQEEDQQDEQQEENLELNSGDENLMDNNTEEMDNEVANFGNEDGNNEEIIENTEEMPMNNEMNANMGAVENMAPVENVVATEAVPVDPSGRVVRYITADETPVFSQADSGASAVASMSQGDAVVVNVQGAWAMVGEGRYISSDRLSDQVVPRSRSANAWN